MVSAVFLIPAVDPTVALAVVEVVAALEVVYPYSSNKTGISGSVPNLPTRIQLYLA